MTEAGALFAGLPDWVVLAVAAAHLRRAIAGFAGERPRFFQAMDELDRRQLVRGLARAAGTGAPS